jgi:hypothetical protein
MTYNKAIKRLARRSFARAILSREVAACFEPSLWHTLL